MLFREQDKKKAITFSYDDGVTQDIQLVELLNKYNLKCTFNINSGLLGKRGILIRQGKRVSHYRLHAEDLRYVYEGHEVAAHTLHHPLLTKLEEAEIIQEVERDRLGLSDLMQYEVVGMAYPGGGINNDDRVAEIIRQNTGIRYARTTTNTDSLDLQENLFRFNPNVYHVMELDRMMEYGKQFLALKADKPQVLYIWGHSYEMDYRSDYWVKLEEFFQLISNQEDIFYGTNAEILL